MRKIALITAGILTACVALSACGGLDQGAAPPASAQRYPSSQIGTPGSNAP